MRLGSGRAKRAVFVVRIRVIPGAEALRSHGLWGTWRDVIVR